ncbi:DUF3597 family protein [Bradyrhizobium ottawaense]
MLSSEVFRFGSVRPSVKPKPSDEAIFFARFDNNNPSNLSPFAKKLSAIGSPQKVQEAAKDYKKEQSYKTETIAEIVNAAEVAVNEATREAAIKAASAVLKPNLGEYLNSEVHIASRSDYWDSYYASVLSEAGGLYEIASIMLMLKCFHYLEWLAGAEKDVTANLTWDEVLQIRPVIPSKIVSLPAVSKKVDRPKLSEDAKEDLNRVYEFVQVRIRAADEIEAIDALDHGVFGAQAGVTTTAESGAEAAAVTTSTTAEGKIDTLPLWIKTDEGLGLLSEPTRALVSPLVPRMDTIRQLLDMLRDHAARAFGRFVNAQSAPNLYLLRTSREYHELTLAVSVPDIEPALLLEDPHPTPDERGIKPSGIGDLYKINQVLLRYELGEVAHVENVLQSEYRKRSHLRIDEVRETEAELVEKTSENERDLQSTERYELTREVQKSVEERVKSDAGVSVSASYGPVTVSAHADIAVENSSAEVAKEASNYAKQTTDRAISKLVTRVSTERIRATLNRIEEKNTHGFDNKGGTKNVTGVYRWVDKLYQARLVNYGKRLMLEFIAPEPAAFYLAALAGKANRPLDVEKPEPPTIYGRPLLPTDLTAGNYATYVARYRVRSVDAYPAPTLHVNIGTTGTPNASANAGFAATDDTTSVPDGYQARWAYGWWAITYFGSYILNIFVGGKKFDSYGGDAQTAKVKVTVNGWLSSYNVNMVLVCEPTHTAIERWRNATYEKIVEGYVTAQSDYRRAFEAMTARDSPDFATQSSKNEEIEKSELKKSCIRLITNHFAATKIGGIWRYNELFDSTQEQPLGPELDVGEALIEGKIIRFFEQAFEWQNMVYTYYPYFWGRKEKWQEMAVRDHSDGRFATFLRAGAARVIVPVTPTFVEAVLYYLKSNIIWNGGDVPTVDDPLYISIIQELRAEQVDESENLPACSADSGYPCVADEWEIRVPTTLVYLQDNSSLPVFDAEVPSDSVAKKLDEEAAKLGGKLDWRHSVADLLRVLHRPSNKRYRVQLAKKMNCPQSLIDEAGSAKFNIWLHDEILEWLRESKDIPKVAGR